MSTPVATSSPEQHHPMPDGPAQEPIEGPSFSFAMKMLASNLVGWLGLAAWRVIADGALSSWDDSTRIAMGMALIIVFVSYIGILTSRTGIDGQTIHQRGLWSKEVRLADITQIKLIALPGLGWLIAPRLVVRAGGLTVTTFHAGDPRVLAAFRRLAYG